MYGFCGSGVAASSAASLPAERSAAAQRDSNVSGPVYALPVAPGQVGVRDLGRETERGEVRPADDRVVVRGVNIVKRHTRQSAKSQGGIVEQEAALHVSNVAHADPKSGKPTRVGFKIDGDKKVRVAKRSGVSIDG